MPLRGAAPRRSARRIQQQARARRREEKPRPRTACSQPCSRPLVLEGPPHPTPREKQFGVTLGEHKIFGYIWGSHFSGTQPRVFQGKAAGQHRRVSTVGCAACWSGGICLLLGGDGGSACLGGVGPVRSGQAGRMRQAQFCWWGAWAPWVLWADEGPESNEPLVPEGAGSQAGGRFWICLAEWAVGQPWTGAFNCLGPGGRQAASVAAWPQAGLAREQQGYWEPRSWRGL